MVAGSAFRKAVCNQANAEGVIWGLRKIACPNEEKALKQSMVVLARDSSTRVVEAAGPGVEGHPQLYKELIPG